MVTLQKIPIPWSERLRDFSRGPLTFGVWIVALAGSSWLLAHRGGGGEFMGLARGSVYELSTPVSGVIDTLLVDQYGSVQAGDVVATLDDADLSARLATERAEISRLAAELEAARARQALEDQDRQAESSSDLLRFQIEEVRHRIDGMTLRVDLEEDRVEEQRLSARIDREQSLTDEGLLTEARLDDLVLGRDEVRQRIAHSGELLAQLDEAARQATLRRERFESAVGGVAREDSLLSPLREAIAVQQRRVESLQGERKHLLVRAWSDGQVVEILARPGQAIVPGQPVVRIAAGEASDIVVWVPESEAARYAAGAEVLVGRQRPAHASRVQRVGPTVEPMPARLWRDANQPEYGRALVVSLVPDLRLLPGESVRVRLVD